MPFTPGQVVVPQAFVSSMYPYTPYTPAEQIIFVGKACIFDGEGEVVPGTHVAFIHLVSDPSIMTMWPLNKIS